MTIDSCYEGLIKYLTNQYQIVEVSAKLAACKNNSERVLLVTEIMKKCSAFPIISVVEKSVETSTFYKDLGNKEFQKLNDHAALQYYNLSLLHAPPNSESYAVAIANRSAVLGHMKKFKECVLDIQKVFTLQVPEKTKEKLSRRLDLCNQAIANSENEAESMIKDIILLQSKHPKFLSASSKIDVVYTKEMGRHVKATEDIEVGEVIASEEPYFVLLLKSQLLVSCSNCLSRSAHLLPCDKCCFALYCSETCRMAAWKSYHSVECHLMATFFKLEFTKLELLALRVVVKARSDHSNWSDLFETIRVAEENVDTEKHGCVLIGDQWVYDSKSYTPIHCLATNVEKRSISDIFQKSVTASVLLNLLKEGTSFLEATNGEKEELIVSCVAELLLRHGMTSPTNMHNISAIMENSQGNFVDEVSCGSAPYAFLSLINHSCAPNVVRANKLQTGKTFLLALRPIKKGMQLFDNYGSHHALEDRASRQHQLHFQYRFACACEACAADWPTYLRLRRNAAPPPITKQKAALLDEKAIEKLQKGDKNFALEVFKPLCELATILEPYAPCIDLADCQEALKQCLSIFGGVIPHGYSRVIDWPAIPKRLQTSVI